MQHAGDQDCQQFAEGDQQDVKDQFTSLHARDGQVQPRQEKEALPQQDQVLAPVQQQLGDDQPQAPHLCRSPRSLINFLLSSINDTRAVIEQLCTDRGGAQAEQVQLPMDSAHAEQERGADEGKAATGPPPKVLDTQLSRMRLQRDELMALCHWAVITYKQRRSEACAKIAELENTVQQLRDDSKVDAQKLAEYGGAAARAEKKARKLETALEDLRATKESLEADNEAHLAKETEYRDKFVMSQRENRKLREESKGLVLTNERLATENTALGNQVESLTSDLSEARKACMAPYSLRQENCKLEMANENLRARLQSIELEKDSEMADIQAEANALLKQAHMEVDSLKRRLQELRITQGMRKGQDDRQQLEAKLAEQELQLAECRRDNDELMREMEMLIVQIQHEDAMATGKCFLSYSDWMCGQVNDARMPVAVVKHDDRRIPVAGNVDVSCLVRLDARVPFTAGALHEQLAQQGKPAHHAGPAQAEYGHAPPSKYAQGLDAKIGQAPAAKYAEEGTQYNTYNTVVDAHGYDAARQPTDPERYNNTEDDYGMHAPRQFCKPQAACKPPKPPPLDNGTAAIPSQPPPPPPMRNNGNVANPVVPNRLRGRIVFPADRNIKS